MRFYRRGPLRKTRVPTSRTRKAARKASSITVPAFRGRAELELGRATRESGVEESVLKEPNSGLLRESGRRDPRPGPGPADPGVERVESGRFQGRVLLLGQVARTAPEGADRGTLHRALDETRLAERARCNPTTRLTDVRVSDRARHGEGLRIVVADPPACRRAQTFVYEHLHTTGRNGVLCGAAEQNPAQAQRTAYIRDAVLKIHA